MQDHNLYSNLNKSKNIKTSGIITSGYSQDELLAEIKFEGHGKHLFTQCSASTQEGIQKIYRKLKDPIVFEEFKKRRVVRMIRNFPQQEFVIVCKSFMLKFYLHENPWHPVIFDVVENHIN